MSTDRISRPPAVPIRPSEGRWLGGVCAAIARARQLKIAWVRLAFVLVALFGGLGVIAYAACWLIMPGEGDDKSDSTPARGIVVLAQACGACLGLGLLAAVAGAATVFGFGWAVLACAAAVLLVTMFVWPRLGPASALLPICALVLPSVAVAAAGLRLSTQTNSVVVAPRALSATSYDSGLGTLLVDLRRTSLPSSGVHELRIHAGVRRTIVALPEGECVHVAVNYTVKPFLGRLAALLEGREDRPFSAVVVFGRLYGGLAGGGNPGPAPGPTLKIDVSSMGGALYVRDYPDGVNPNLEPDWPGYRVTLEPKPSTRGLSRRKAVALIRAWRGRYRRELQSKRFVDAHLPGPCGAHQ